MKEIIITAQVSDEDAEKFKSFMINAILSRTKVLEEKTHNTSVSLKTEVVLNTEDDINHDVLSNRITNLSDCGVVVFNTKPIINISTRSDLCNHRYVLTKQNNYIKVS